MVEETYRNIYTAIGQDELDKVLRMAGLGLAALGIIATKKWLKENITRVAKEVSKTTSKIIRRIVGRGKDDKSKGDIIREIKNAAVFNEGRLKLIVRTESTRTINGAMDSAYVQA